MTHYTKAQYGPPAVTSALIFECIAKAGNSGATMAELVAATGKTNLQIGALLDNLKGRHGCRRVMIYSLTVFGRIARYFAADVPLEIAQAVVEREGEKRRIEGKRASKLKELERKARHRARAKAQREANTDAIAEKQALREKAKKDAAERKALEAQQRAQRLALRKTMKAEAAMNNHLARKVRGTTRGIVQVEEKPAPSVDWSQAHVTKAPRPLGRWEVESVPRMFRDLPFGQYLDAAA